MRAVYQAEHLIDAHLVRGRLQSEGIQAWVRGEWLTGALGELPLQGLLAVCVREQDQAAALELLAVWRDEADRLGDAGDPDDAGADPAFLA
jgi:hypothetical protein